MTIAEMIMPTPWLLRFSATFATCRLISRRMKDIKQRPTSRYFINEKRSALVDAYDDNTSKRVDGKQAEIRSYHTTTDYNRSIPFH